MSRGNKGEGRANEAHRIPVRWALGGQLPWQVEKGVGAEPQGFLHYPTQPSDYPTAKKEALFSGKTEPQKLHTERYEARKAEMGHKGKARRSSLGPSVSFPHPLHSTLAPCVKFPRQESRGAFSGETAWSSPISPENKISKFWQPRHSFTAKLYIKEPKSSAQVSETLWSALLWNTKGQVRITSIWGKPQTQTRTNRKKRDSRKQCREQTHTKKKKEKEKKEKRTHDGWPQRSERRHVSTRTGCYEKRIKQKIKRKTEIFKNFNRITGR